MTAFNPIPLMKLYNMAKKAKYDGYGHKIVYIDARKKSKNLLNTTKTFAKFSIKVSK